MGHTDRPMLLLLRQDPPLRKWGIALRPLARYPQVQQSSRLGSIHWRVLYSGNLPGGCVRVWCVVCCVLWVRLVIDSANHDLTCEICGGHMVEQKCKIRCPNCGFTRDCSDP
jgi:hypothetical protein